MRIDSSPRVPGELLVQLKPGIQAEEMPFEVLDRLEVAGHEVLHVKARQDERVFAQDERVERVAPNHLYHRADVRPDDLDPRMWGLSNDAEPG